MPTINVFESTPDLDVRGRRDSLPEINSRESQEQISAQHWQTTAQLWKQRLKQAPSMSEIQACILAQRVHQLPHSGLTHFGSGLPSEYFVDDFIVMRITEHRDHFPDAGDTFCEELGETPANDPDDAPRRRCGFGIASKLRDDEQYNDFEIVRWYEMAAVACDAIESARLASTDKPEKFII